MIGVKWTRVPRWIKFLALTVALPWWIFWLCIFQLLRVLMTVAFYIATWDVQMTKNLWRDTL